jgi:hypothetical protein
VLLVECAEGSRKAIPADCTVAARNCYARKLYIFVLKMHREHTTASNAHKEGSGSNYFTSSTADLTCTTETRHFRM